MAASLAAKCAEEPIMYIEPSNYNAISTAATTLVKSGNGVLLGVVINAKGTVASTITIYDALTATGTPIATIDSLNLSNNFNFNVFFTVGLTIVTTGTAAPNITVLYR
jgi:hypothetical protein